MSSSSGRKVAEVDDRSPSTRTRRGTLSGTFTRANRSPPPSGSRTVTARFSDSPEM